MELEQDVLRDVVEGEAEVYVVTAEGELLSAAEVLMKGSPVGSPIAKGTAQIDDTASRAALWVEPRISYDDLLTFLDWNTWHRRCCVVKALLTVGLGWRVERKAADGKPSTIYDALTGEGDLNDPVVRLLVNPSVDDPTLTLDGLLYREELDYHATGDGYLELVYDDAGRLAELYHVPCRTMRRGGRRGLYFQVKGTRHVPFLAYGRGPAFGLAGARSEILHLLEYDPKSDDYGMAGWVGALAPMGLDRTVIEFNTNIFRNALMAHMAIVVRGGKLSKAGRDAVKQFVRDRAQGVENAGRVLLIEDENDRIEIRFEKLNLEIKDLMLTGVQTHLRDVVVGAHGVPPRILGIVTPGQLGATGEVEGQLRIFRETVTRTRQRQLEGTLARVLAASGYEGYRVRFNELDITSLEADSDLLDVLLDRGVFSPEELRPYAERLIAG